MFGGKDVAAVHGRKLLAFVEDHLQRGIMWLHENVGDNHFVLQLGMLALTPRILVAADVVPRPAVEASVLNVCDVFRWKIVSDIIALVH